MSPFAFIIAIVAIAQFATAYPQGASGAVQLPSPTSNLAKQSASASTTPIPSESPLPNTANPIQGASPVLDSIPQNSPISICDQGPGSENIVQAAGGVYDSFRSAWSPRLFTYPIYLLFVILVLVLSLVGIRCSFEQILEIRACCSRKKRKTQCPEETQPENPEGAQPGKSSPRETPSAGEKVELV